MSIPVQDLIDQARGEVNDPVKKKWQDTDFLRSLRTFLGDLLMAEPEAFIDAVGALSPPTMSDINAGTSLELGDEYRGVLVNALCRSFFAADAGDKRDLERWKQYDAMIKAFFQPANP